MRNAQLLFEANITSAKQSGSIFDFLKGSITAPLSFDDLLRFQVVYSVSAFDKLIHDLVRIGMVDTFKGTRSPTAKYLNEPISLKTFAELTTQTLPPKEHIFEQALFQKFKTVSFQDPAKIADGLSYIWDESQKWQKISHSMSVDESSTKTTMRLIADRRNAIVHEADINPVTFTKYSITKQECDEITAFLRNCGNAIANLVII